MSLQKHLTLPFIYMGKLAIYYHKYWSNIRNHCETVIPRVPYLGLYFLLRMGKDTSVDWELSAACAFVVLGIISVFLVIFNVLQTLCLANLLSPILWMQGRVLLPKIVEVQNTFSKSDKSNFLCLTFITVDICIGAAPVWWANGS